MPCSGSRRPSASRRRTSPSSRARSPRPPARPLPDYASLWRWSNDEREAFWRAVWDYAGIIGTRGERTLVDSDAHARREVVSRCAPQFRREPARAPRARRRGRCAGLSRRGQAVAPRLARGARRRRRARGGRAEGAGRGRGRSRRGVPAEHARGDHRDARGDEPRARSGRRARRISACRACSTASARSSRACSSPSTATGTTARPLPIADKVAAIVARLPTVERVVVIPYLEATGQRPAECRRRPRRRRLGRIRRAARRRADRLRAPAVRPPALHPLFVGHDRRAEVHRPRRRAARCCSTSRSTCCTAT